LKIFLVFRALIFSLIFFPLLTFFLSAAGVFWFFLTGRQDLVAWTLWTWSRWNLRFLGTALDVRGQEFIPKSGCLFLFNHKSFVDIFALSAVVYRIRFGAKIELFSIPAFGLAMRAGGALPIPRKDRSKAIHILKEAEARARDGEQFALAPEGGRGQKEGLLPFKSGPFIFAIEAGIPVVPVVIRGAWDLWPKGALLPALNSMRSVLELEFLAPTATQGMHVDQRQELSDKIRSQMLACLESRTRPD
jgi:1-acyl-sn-glycerol-3-phosphate acyltransferase